MSRRPLDRILLLKQEMPSRETLFQVPVHQEGRGEAGERFKTTAKRAHRITVEWRRQTAREFIDPSGKEVAR